jgi:hypothetical protein
VIMRGGFLCFTAALLLTGCAGYKLGPSNGLEAGSRTVQINPPVNKTPEPRIAEELNHQLRRQIQRDGTYRLATREDGDVVVNATITKYNRIGETFLRRDTLTARDYRIQLIALVTAHDRISGKTFVNREFVGRTLVRIGSDQASAERQALPLLTEDLARIITSAIADGEW